MEIRKLLRNAMAAGLIAWPWIGAFGQGPAFEAASVKPASPSTGNELRVMMGSNPGRINYSNVTLRAVVARAYNVKNNQISGPSWLDSERYDIVAKLPAETPKEQIPPMLQALLADRFKLTLHREEKVLPVYELVAAKSGTKLHEADAEAGLRISMGPKGRQMTGKVSLSRFSDSLSNWMDRPVIDKTGLNGIYDIDIEWTPDENQPGLRSGPGGGPRPEGGEGRSASERSDGPSIFTAVQEKLGLKLEARKSPVEILIIDHAEKIPTEN